MVLLKVVVCGTLCLGGAEMRETNVVATSIGIPRYLLDMLDEEAEKESRSRSKMVSLILEEHYKKQGVIK